MSLFAEIKRDVLNPDTKLSTILRKLKVFAVGTDDKLLLEWVNRELNGYNGVPLKDYPNYRVFSALNRGHFLGWGGSQMNNVEVHTLGLPEFAKEFASSLWIEEGLPEIERMCLTPNADWRRPWPPDLVAALAAQFFQNYRAMEVWKVVPSGALEYVISSVRDKMLDYLLELEKTNPQLVASELAANDVGDNAASKAVSVLIDNEQKAKRGPDSLPSIKPMKVFISYSHKDEVYREELETHIKILNRRGLISVWHDRKIGGGREWKGEIDNNLREADIILLLISADFVASDYCYDIEVDQALKNHESGKSTVVPVIVRTSHLKGSKFMHLQALPTDAKAISTWADRDEAFTVVTRGLEGVILDRQEHF